MGRCNVANLFCFKVEGGHLSARMKFVIECKQNKAWLLPKYCREDFSIKWDGDYPVFRFPSENKRYTLAKYAESRGFSLALFDESHS
jgi:hypothetical protein